MGMRTGSAFSMGWLSSTSAPGASAGTLSLGAVPKSSVRLRKKVLLPSPPSASTWVVELAEKTLTLEIARVLRDKLEAQGVTVVRHNLSQDPQPFVSNTRVLDLMQREGTECLPINLPSGGNKSVVDTLLNNEGTSDFDTVRRLYAQASTPEQGVAEF